MDDDYRIGRPGDNERGMKILYIVPEDGDEVIAYDTLGTFEDLADYMESQNGIFVTSLESCDGYEIEFDIPLVESDDQLPVYVFEEEGNVVYSVH